MSVAVRASRVCAALAILGGLALGEAAWAAPSGLAGEYETARTHDDEFTRLTLKPDGRATIVAENNFQIPGDPEKRRGRTTTYGKWTAKGAVVTLTYSKVRDRLRFDAATPLARIGQSGKAPALIVNKSVAGSRLNNATLWRLPHAFKLPEPASAPATSATSPK